MSPHAEERWQQRCPHLILEDELATRHPAGKPIVTKLAALWRYGHAMPQPESDVFVSANGAVFLVRGEVVVTVMTTRLIRDWYEDRVYYRDRNREKEPNRKERRRRRMARDIEAEWG
jgi:hypothetical protein